MSLDLMVAGLNKTGGLQIKTPETARNVVTIFAMVWGNALAERGLDGAVALMQRSFDELDRRLTAAGLQDAVAETFGPIRREFALATDPAFARAIKAASGLAEIMRSES